MRAGQATELSEDNALNRPSATRNAALVQTAVETTRPLASSPFNRASLTPTYPSARHTGDYNRVGWSGDAHRLSEWYEPPVVKQATVALLIALLGPGFKTKVI